MKIRLIRKLAEKVNGVDLSRHHEGEIFDLPPHEALLLVAEDWAVLMPERAHADDRSSRKKKRPMR